MYISATHTSGRSIKKYDGRGHESPSWHGPYKGRSGWFSFWHGDTAVTNERPGIKLSLITEVWSDG